MAINPVDPNIDNLPSAYDTTNSDRFEAKINRNPSFNITDTPTRVTAEWGNEGDGFTRAVQQRLSLAFVNAREHGVKGDGATNDDAAFATMVAVGAAVYYLPPGTYIVTGDVTFTAGSVVMAAGVIMSGGNLVGARLILSGTNGNVVAGPASSVDASLATFDGVTGQILQAPGTLEANLTLVGGSRAFTGAVSGITPTLAAHLATKGYVDAPTYVSVSGAEATPDVAGLTRITLGGVTTITDFLNGVDGQILVCWNKSGARTVQHNANLNLRGTADFAMVVDDVLTLSFDGSNWTEVSRMLADGTDAGDDKVNGPASSVNLRLPTFNGVSGRFLNDSGTLESDVTLIGGSRAFTGTVSGVTPTIAAHLATKGYVDAPGITAFSGASATFDADEVSVATVDADATDITDFTNGAASQSFILIATGNRTIIHGAPIALNGSVDFDMVSGSTLTLVNDGSKWFETGRRT